MKKRGYYLIEQILLLLVFALCACVCLRIFALAQQVSAESEELTCAVNAARSAAECLKATEGDLDQTSSLLGGTRSGSVLRVSYGADWTAAAPEDPPVYSLTLTASGTAAVITVQRESDARQIYELEVRVVHNGT